MSGQKCVFKHKLGQNSDCKQSSIVTRESSGCVLSCCQSCSFCSFTRASTKERSKPRQLSEQNKVCQKCFLCRSLCFCPCCAQCPQCCLRTQCRGQTSGVLASLASHGFKSPGSLYPKKGLHFAFQTKTSSNQVPSGSKWLCKPVQKHASQRGSCKPHAKVGSRKGGGQVVPGFYNRLFLVPKPNGKWRPILDLSRLNLFLNTGTFKMETPETIRLSLKAGEWVTSLDFSDAYFHIPIAPRSRKYLRFFLFHQTFQFTALPFGLATAPLEFTKVVKEVKLMAQAKGIRIHQYLDDWLLRAPSPEICLQHTQTLLALCRQLGWVVNMTKSELVPKQVFNFVGYRFDLITGRVLPTQDRWEALQEKLRFMKDRHHCTVRQFMSLIGLLTATEKQVCAGRLHMRPIQWHLKRHWHVPEVLEKLIPVPQSLHPHLDWWLDEANVLKGQPLHPLQHAVQLFTDASNEGWGAHLGDFTARGVWSPLEGRLHINFLEMKAVLLALRQLEHLCKGQIVLVATDNTTVVSYINKQGGMRSGSLCALLWRLLSWCHHRGITLRARHIPGRLNVIADKLSRHNQVIQTEWALSPQVFSQLCSRWPPPLVDLFATRFNHKLPRFVSPVPDQAAWAVDALSLSWERLNAYAFPPVSLLPQVVSKIRDQGCHRMILIAPGWPNMPWFWDLVDLSVQIPFTLPLTRDLVTQPFNGLVHRSLPNLNLHAWLLEALPSGNTASLKRWQQELRLLRGVQPEPCTSQSGPYLSSGVNRTRWTSGHPL